MREVPADVLSHLQTNQGVEPLLIVEIQWADNGPRVMYSDQKLSGLAYPYPIILQVGDFDMATQIDGSGDSQQLSITLDDTDGVLKTLLDEKDIHKRPVWVYQGFQGLTVEHKFLLFKGEISSPLIWSEGERTLTLDVLTRQEDAEVGFSMEEGDFLSIPNEALGVVWPLVFGEVCNIPAVQVRAPRRGVLSAGEGIHDFTLPNRICQGQYLQCGRTFTGDEIHLIEDQITAKLGPVEVPTFGPDYPCIDSRWELVCQLQYLLYQQLSYENTQFEIKGGDEFPQNQTVTLNIHGALFTGTFDGTTFQVIERIHPEYDETELIPCRRIPERHRGLIRVGNFTTDGDLDEPFTPADPNWQLSDAGTVYEPNPLNPSLGACREGSIVLRPGMTGGPAEAQKAFDDMPTSSFVWLPPGTDVFLEDEAELLHIVSLIPGTINHVAAYKKRRVGPDLLLEVPAEWYTVYETDYEGYTVIEVGLEKKLSQRDPDWSDEIYVSFTSDIGPNPVDIIQWLAEKYTSLVVDATSFAIVQASMVNYPTNFALTKRMSVLGLIQNIAYQTRCAVYVRNGVIFIKYLATEPTSVRVITSSDILAKSFQITHTPSEDLITKSVVNWQSTGIPFEAGRVVEKTIVLKHNIPKYGVHEGDYDYYTQNTFETILKSATFWLIRDSHTWKYVEFDTTIKHLDLDLFDCITLNLPQFSASPVKCIITEATFNNKNNIVHFRAWTPIRAGTTEPYSLAWPANLPAQTVWPLDGETRWANPGYAFQVVPPLDHILSGGNTDDLENFVVQSSGDQYPSDLGDVFPAVLCEISDLVESDIQLEAPEFRALKLAKRNRVELQRSASTGSPMSYSLKDEEDKNKDEEDTKPERIACGESQPGSGCMYEVNVTYVYPTKVTSGRHLGGCKGGPCWCEERGVPCFGPLRSKCHAFSSARAAAMFQAQMQGTITGLKDGCGYACHAIAPYMVGGVRALPDPILEGAGEPCKDYLAEPINTPYVEYAPKWVKPVAEFPDE